MTEILIGIPPNIFNMPDDWLACVPTNDTERIFFNPHIPKNLHSYVEENLVPILLHELLHQIILALEGENTSKAFDRFFNDNREKKIQFCKELYK